MCPGRRRLLRLLVLGVLAVPPAVFLLDDLGSVGFLVPECRVIDPRANRALQLDGIGHGLLPEVGRFSVRGWSPGAGLNCRPLPYQGSALPLSYPGSRVLRL